ncbi:MAG: protein translocase subunit SecD [SAR324 cluster bacterium]|uniref:Protein translocase subunit SecD n=1 Tax=SAR324 cluster bacterium TaxID=2024889 RepID=A0A7X9IJX3_9DELT|nr:protein translocase subunit SecD [SAR324 cluster bacterium]
MGIDVRKRFFVVAGVLIAAVLFLLPTFFPKQMPANWISKPLSLGLDLSGGIHLVYQVQTDEALKSRLQSMGNMIRSELKKEKIPVLRVRVPEEKTLEMTFLSESSADRAQKRIESDYRNLMFKQKKQDEGRSVLLFTIADTYAAEIKRNAVRQSIETLRSRVDQFGVTEPVIQQIGEERVLLQMPGVSDIAAVKRVVGSVAKLEFRLLHTSTSTSGRVMMKDSEGGSVAVEDEVLMTGDAVDDARVAFSTATHGAEVSLSLNSEGAKTFAKITGEHVGEQLAIILDGIVKSSPRINERIGGGKASISGSFGAKEAEELAVVLRAGALPAPLNVLEERMVGPTLGKESIKAGITAIIATLIFIGLFMVWYYKKSGLIAVMSLALNVFLVMACLSAFGATLTLPGLAGLALTVGMAVDSNVLIVERIREELRNGASRDAAVVAGFDRALSAIIDSNITEILSASILYFVGTGAIRGFAVVTAIGIVMTLFCAVFVARTFYELFELKGKDQLISV